jgi:outer membrane protein TolC
MLRFCCLMYGLLGLVFAQPNATILLYHDDAMGPAGLADLVQRELDAISQGRLALSYQVQPWPSEDLPPYDLLITLGVQSSQALIQRGDYPQPTIIGTVLDPQIQGLPRNASGGSGQVNLNYLRTPYDVAADLAQFRQVADFKQLAILADRDLAALAGSIGANLMDLAQGDETFTLLPLDEASPAEVIAQLPEDCDAVYLLPLGEFYQGNNRRALLDSLSGAGLPTFAMLGSEWVEAGALASRAPDQSAQAIARRIALNALAILEGEPASQQPTQLAATGDDFVINLRAVRRSGVYPGWRALGEARLVNLEEQPDGPPVHLRGVIGEALVQNLSFQISQRETEAGQQDVRLALADLLPELSVGSNFNAIDQARSAASFGSTQPYTWAASATLEQVLFAEPLYANLRIQKFLQASRVASQDQAELDVVLEATEAYFTVLLAGSVLRLQNQNVDNTRINLNLAQDKEAVGYSGVSEVYRWETQLALNKVDLNDAQANVRSARFRLNQVLNRPQSEPFALTEAEMGDSLLSVLDPRLFTYLSDPGQLDRLADFFVAEGRRNLPELAQINLSLQAQERLLQSRRRAFYLPTFGLNAQTGYNLYQGGYASEEPIPPQFEAVLPEPITGVTWSVGVGLNFPLYQGGSRQAQKQQTTIDLARLRSQRQDVQNQLELRIRSGLQTAGASFAEIGLARKAATAAQQNLRIAQDGYREGIVPIAQLIDAQEAALQTDILASNAVFSFLLDFLTVERAIGFYYFLAPLEEQAAFFVRADQFFAE